MCFCVPGDLGVDHKNSRATHCCIWWRDTAVLTRASYTSVSKLCCFSYLQLANVGVICRAALHDLKTYARMHFTVSAHAV